MQNNRDLHLGEIQNLENANKEVMSKKELRTAEFKRLYPLRSHWAYRRLLPKKMYLGGQIVFLIQVFCMMGMFVEQSWQPFLILMSGIAAFICFFTVGVKEEEGHLYDNWRGIVYKCLSVTLLVQLLICGLLNSCAK